MPVGSVTRGAAVVSIGSTQYGGVTSLSSSHSGQAPRFGLVWAQAKQGATPPPPYQHPRTRPHLVPTRLLAQVVSMGQVLTLLGLSVADPLRSAVAVLSIDVPALFIHFECHGIKHSYYAGWLVAANFPRPRFGAAFAHRRTWWLNPRSCSGAAPGPARSRGTCRLVGAARR